LAYSPSVEVAGGALEALAKPDVTEAALALLGQLAATERAGR
jgi:hypothetical protein